MRLVFATRSRFFPPAALRLAANRCGAFARERKPTNRLATLIYSPERLSPRANCFLPSTPEMLAYRRNNTEVPPRCQPRDERSETSPSLR